MPPKRVATAVLLVFVLAFPAAALAGNGGVAPPPSDTPSGDAIREVYWVALGVCAFVFVAVEAALVLFIVRFRRRRTTARDAEGPQIHGNTRVEIAWTIVPAVMLAGLGVFTLLKVSDVQADPSASEQAAVARESTVHVQAHEFYWQYTYPNGAISLDTLYVPAGQTTQLRLSSEDVVHSWWVPELTGKMDAIPGRTNILNFKPRTPGSYEGVCAELCGIQHAVMRTTVKVLPYEEYRQWLRESAPGAQDPVALGKQEWTAACAKCHSLDGGGLVGPPIAGNATILEVESLKRLLLEGQDTPALESFMPAVGRSWQDRQFQALVAYLKSNKQLSTSPAQGGASGG